MVSRITNDTKIRVTDCHGFIKYGESNVAYMHTVPGITHALLTISISRPLFQTRFNEKDDMFHSLSKTWVRHSFL